MVRYQFVYASRILLALVLVLSTFYLSAQEGVYSIKWLPNRVEEIINEDIAYRYEYPHFEGAVINFSPLFPGYSKEIILPADLAKSVGFRIANLKYESVPDSMVADLQFAEFPVPCQKAYIRKSGSERHLYLQIDVLRKDPATGLIERLVNFEVQKILSDEVAGVSHKSAFLDLENSLLNSGSWFKFHVPKTGIYRLTYGDLKELGFTAPENIRIYGNGGKQLSYFNGDPRPVDLVEIPLYKNKGSDGIFGEGDNILFYLEGPVTWQFDSSKNRFVHDMHHYANQISYFLTTSQGLATEITTRTNPLPDANAEVNSFSDYAYYEWEKYNLIGSGRTWYSKRFDEAGFDTTFTFPNIKTGVPYTVDARIVARSRQSRNAFLYIDGEPKDTVRVKFAEFAYSWLQYANEASLIHTGSASGNSINVQMEYNKYETGDLAYVDYITVNARRELKRTDDAFFFRDLNSVGEGKTARFTIGNASSGMQVWDVTDIHDVYAMSGELSGQDFSFTARADILRQYALINPSVVYPKPVIDASRRGVGMISNQNLRGLSLVNYLIISHERFFVQANRLADWHRQNSGLTVAVVTPEQIYNEFSAGTPDVSAIRDFIRQHYNKKTSGDSLRYILLFGDGSYNNHNYNEGNTNYILTYQSINSLLPTASYSADDFYGLLEDDEGGVNETTDLKGDLEIGIGRMPVRLINNSDMQAREMVDKIIRYTEGTFKDWRRILTFIGDDGYDAGANDDGNRYMGNADSMTGLVKQKYEGFEYKKIYLDAYKQVSTSTGAFYPEAHLDLINTLNRGTLLTTYFGHGSENQITSERVLQKSDVKALKNKYLTVFITATCSFSRYDDVDINVDANEFSAKTSAGEEALLNPDGGAIALLSTSRVVYSGENFNLASHVFSHIFDKDDKGNPVRIGDVYRQAKNNLRDEVNKLNFTLLGDPALRLAFPEFKVMTDSINGSAVAELTDTLKAFGKVTITGHVAYDDSTLISDFNGTVYPRVYDKAVMITTLGNDNSATFDYSDESNLIYKGKATVENGYFSFSFVVPKDISYNLDKGKISYYAENGVIDARGEYKEVFVGGTDYSASIDYEGPDIELYMNDERFEDGGITNNNPYLFARLSDENGINTTGNSIGHDIVATLNSDSQFSYMLNDYYEADIDDYTSGSVHYQLFDLEAGEHTLGLKAWDVFNNSSETFISFVVKDIGDLVVEKLINFPNPANSYTTFQYTHNAPGQHEITLDIFDLAGQLVTSVTRTIEETGFVSEPLTWNISGSSGSRLSDGFYPYRLTVKTAEGISVLSGKLIIFR
jgi:hypothetical protein